MLQPRVAMAKEGEVVIAYQGHGNLTPLCLKHGDLFHCKAGKFHHSDIIGKPLGTYIAGRSNRLNDPVTPHMLFLQLSATLWTQAVPHRTQIIYDTDIAVIVLQLRLGPGRRVVEAGTGSGSLTHSMAKAVAPHGIVFTCDFHKGRCLKAKEEFESHFGVGNTLVSSHWRDVCSTCTETDIQIVEEKQSEKEGGTAAAEEAVRLKIADVNHLESQEAPRPGFGLPALSVDGVFLDVPAPWLSVENVLHVLRPGGILATFSPCIEQTQRLCARLRESPHEFVDIRTVEALTMYFESTVPPASPYTQPAPQGASRKLPYRKRGRDEGSEAGSRKNSETAEEKEEEEEKGGGNPPTPTTAAEPQEGEGEEEARPEVMNSGAAGPATPPRPAAPRVAKLRACPVSKGHSAYLTFARRRLPLDTSIVEEE